MSECAIRWDEFSAVFADLNLVLELFDLGAECADLALVFAHLATECIEQSHGGGQGGRDIGDCEVVIFGFCFQFGNAIV